MSEKRGQRRGERRGEVGHGGSGCFSGRDGVQIGGERAPTIDEGNIETF